MKSIKRIKSNLCNLLHEEILRECDPRAIKNKSDLFSLFFRTGRYEYNFVGGSNDKSRTKHEQVFNLLYPEFDEQVTFGTGEGGYKEYGFKKVTVDFFDERNNIAIEIDGANHNNELQKLKDRIKELFLFIEIGIRTIRFTNEEVEEMLMDRLQGVIFENDLSKIEEILKGSDFIE